MDMTGPFCEAPACAVRLRLSAASRRAGRPAAGAFARYRRRRRGPKPGNSRAMLSCSRRSAEVDFTAREAPERYRPYRQAAPAFRRAKSAAKPRRPRPGSVRTAPPRSETPDSRVIGAQFLARPPTRLETASRESPRAPRHNPKRVSMPPSRRAPGRITPAAPAPKRKLDGPHSQNHRASKCASAQELRPCKGVSNPHEG